MNGFIVFGIIMAVVVIAYLAVCVSKLEIDVEWLTNEVLFLKHVEIVTIKATHRRNMEIRIEAEQKYWKAVNLLNKKQEQYKRKLGKKLAKGIRKSL